MPLILTWPDIALRLALTVLAGFLIGLNRGEHGKPAGLRTTLLVCLAASIAMILANALIITNGRSPDSFVQLDMMRLPLGILTGIGFIGAGTVLKKGDLVIGVTTAATVWFVTVIGLCFGAGQLALGTAAFALAIFILWGLDWLESQMRQERLATFTLLCDGKEGGGITENQLRETLHANGFRITGCSVAYNQRGAENFLQFELRFNAKRHEIKPPAFLKDLARRPGIKTVRWRA